MTKIAFASLFLFAGVALGQDDYQPRNTQAPGEEPPTAQEAADLITVPEGFQVKLFAGDPDVRQPVAMALDDRGRLFVAESYSYKEWKKTGEDRVLIFEDTDNDGVHDSRKIFTSGIDHLSGMTVGWGGVWVCSAPHLLFYPDKNRDDIPDGEPEIILDGWTTEAGHNFFNGLTWGPDGWLYGRHGITKPSFVGKPGTPEDERIGFDCAIWRYHPVTEEFEVVCRGTTNPWGLDWNEAGDMFFTNNVNGHLWHAIPGAFYPRMGERNDPFAKFVYDRIGMCCDHLHHAGAHTDWTKTRDGKGVHGELGGGHSHCGGMIYLGGKWPEKYRGRMFMCNTHGRRVNVDRLDPDGATYVGRHEPDFLHANNPWFRGVDLIYGPDGDVYLSDWVDNGECHDNDGVHRTSGRIYKIIYGEPSPPMKEKLWEMTNEELLGLHEHENGWYARKARWLLMERMAEGKFTGSEWSDYTSEDFGKLEIVHPRVSGSDFQGRYSLTERALNRESKKVSIATICEDIEIFCSDDELRLPKRSDLLRFLENIKLLKNLERFEPVACWVENFPYPSPHPDDEILQLLLYYTIKDHISSSEQDALKILVAAADKHPLFTKNLSQNLAENGVFEPLISFLKNSDNDAAAESVLTGFAAGIRGRTEIDAPKDWPAVFDFISENPDLLGHAFEIQLAFNRADAKEKLRAKLESKNANDKKMALGILRDAPALGLDEALLKLIADPELGPDAITILGKSKNPKIAEKLITNYQSLTTAAQQRTINTLAANKNFATALLDALEKKTIPRHAVTAFHARQILTFKDDALKKKLAAVWGKTGSSSAEKKAEIKKWQNQLLPDVLAKADLKNGKAKYQQLCSACHNLHGEGGAIGPELTGANRDDLYYLLENIIDPSATLPADFRMTVITKKDGSTISGTVNRENEYAVTIGTLTDEVNIDLNDIKKRETLEQSIMPEGLLGGLSDNDVRDLISFLQK